MDFLNNVNWETLAYALITLLTASGVTMGWLKKMCSRIESTNLDVEAHKKEIQSIVQEMRELTRKDKGV